MKTSLLEPSSLAYPSGLATLDPPRLYLRGVLPGLPGIAIVGTRKPSEGAVAFTRALARALVRAGFAVWSGGALGIDAAAHLGALEAGGATVLVSGGGLDRPFPPEHASLFERIAAGGGALLARVPDGVPAQRPGFLARNEVLAAATEATVVVQAGLVSGARSTAAAARRLGRRLLVVPNAPWDEHGIGAAIELTRGAIPVTSAADVLRALGRPLPLRAVPGVVRRARARPNSRFRRPGGRRRGATRPVSFQN